MLLCQLHRGRICDIWQRRLGSGEVESQGPRFPGELRWHLPGLRGALLGVASGLCGRGIPGSVDRSGVEAEAEGGQVMTVANTGLRWESLGRWRASGAVGSGTVGTTVAGKKFSLLSLGCLGVVGVSPEACEEKVKVRKVNGVLHCPMLVNSDPLV